MFNLRKKIIESPSLLMVVGFLALILVGTFLLMLPISSATGEFTDFTTALFTATSASCVTGLIVVDTGTYFSTFGQNVILALIQIGGIGVVFFAVLIMRIKNGRVGLRERVYLSEVYNSSSEKNSMYFIKWIFAIIFIVEFVGAILLSFKFIPMYGLSKGFFYSIFHSVSAFNNAGFDLFGGYSSLTSFSNSGYIMIVIMILITIGGLGFVTIMELIGNWRFDRRLSLTAKIVCVTTVVLFVVGMITFAIFEWNGVAFDGLGALDKLTNGAFLSVAARTAGFNTVSMNILTTGSILLMIFLMYIGASPSSTGGGLKTTTVVIPILCIASILKGNDDIEVFDRRISNKLVFKSLVVISLSFVISFIAIIILSFTENFGLREILFEVASAINTVGISMGITSNLSLLGKYIIMILIFIGRIGPMSMLLSISTLDKKSSGIRKIEEPILIG